MARKLDSVRSADQSRSLSGDDFIGRSLLPSSKVSMHGDEHESDSDSEDEENRDHRFKKKTGQLWSLSKPKLSQKSGIRKSLRPSKYLFRDRRGWNEEKHWERRETPEDIKSKVSWYARQMMRLTEEDKMDEMLELFSVMKEEKIPLTVEIFNIIISAHSKRGKMRRAFKFYNDLKKRAMQATPHTYTSLFNACAKSSSSPHALQNAEKLLMEINSRNSRRDLDMNVITYNAAIQAVTVCGGPFRAFEIYNEMKHNNVKPDGHTFSSLLTACSFDKVEGPSLAIELLAEMKSMKIKPDLYIYNSVLKVIRDHRIFITEKNSQFSTNSVNSKTVQKMKAKNGKDDTNNIQPTPGDTILSLDKTTSPLGKLHTDIARMESSESLALHSYFPGVEKFLQMMAAEEVYPDVRTFQLLLYMTSSRAEEEYLIELMKSCNITPDVTFYNTLVRRSALEGNLLSAKEHMKKLEKTLNIAPSEKSYQVLARGCKNPEDGFALLNEIKSAGFTPAQSVYGTLIAAAAKQKQFTHLIQLLKGMTRDGVQPNERIIAVLERVYNLPCTKPFIKANANRRFVKERRFRHVEQKGFRSFYQNWRDKAESRETPKEMENDDLKDENDFSHL